METIAKCIQLQSEIIDELFLELSAHMTAEELASLPVVAKIQTAALLRQSIEKGLTNGE